jgi:hypothetical protein
MNVISFSCVIQVVGFRLVEVIIYQVIFQFEYGRYSMYGSPVGKWVPV